MRDFEAHIGMTKHAVEDLTKELLLRATIKDVCQLLDLKANVEDVNSTLTLVQKEVEKCVGENEMKRVLDE